MAALTPAEGLLAADIGGTHARFLFGPDAGFPLDLPTRDYHTLDELMADALARLPVRTPGHTDAVLAVAGPVHAGRAALTNLPWTADAAALRQRFGLRRVALINDLEALARGLAGQPPQEAAMLRRGAADGGRCLVISVGTGLGTAYWALSDGKLHIEPAEAGHAGFAPAEDWEMEFLRTLRRDYGERVSWERVLSGPGLSLLEAFGRKGEALTPAEVVHRAASGDDAAVTALRRFSRLLGAFAGDLVLSAPARGGVWLAGGVLAGLGPLFDTGAFLQAFDAKGRLSPLLGSVPVHRTDDGSLGVRGALLAARAGHHAYRRDLWASA